MTSHEVHVYPMPYWQHETIKVVLKYSTFVIGFPRDENGVKSKCGSELCHFVEHSTNDIHVILWSIIIGLSFGNIPINCFLSIKLKPLLTN
ncbi:hypothetical protein BLOT_010734 [Blomia tropicalis]|nr:hypothetical protein BLOT_010734 [Blomia tropicalis]